MSRRKKAPSAPPKQPEMRTTRRTTGKGKVGIWASSWLAEGGGSSRVKEAREIRETISMNSPPARVAVRRFHRPDRSGSVFLSSFLTPSSDPRPSLYLWQLFARAHASAQPSRSLEPDAGRRRRGSAAPPRFSRGTRANCLLHACIPCAVIYC